MVFITKALFVAIMAVAGANAAAAPPPRPVVARPSKPQVPQFNMQTINCGGGASPYCCSPSTSQASSGGLLNEGDQSAGTTCSKLSGSVQCNAIVVCCNNNGKNANQDCSASISMLKQPIILV